MLHPEPARLCKLRAQRVRRVLQHADVAAHRDILKAHLEKRPGVGFDGGEDADGGADGAGTAARVGDERAHLGMRVVAQVPQARGQIRRADEQAVDAIDGVDGLFIGPSDLAASLGYLGQNAHPEVRALITDACRRARAVGTPMGILAPVEADARAFLEMGFQYVAVGSDVAVLRKAVTELRSRFS